LSLVEHAKLKVARSQDKAGALRSYPTPIFIAGRVEEAYDGEPGAKNVKLGGFRKRRNPPKHQKGGENCVTSNFKLALRGVYFDCVERLDL